MSDHSQEMWQSEWMYLNNNKEIIEKLCRLKLTKARWCRLVVEVLRLGELSFFPFNRVLINEALLLKPATNKLTQVATLQTLTVKELINIRKTQNSNTNTTQKGIVIDEIAAIEEAHNAIISMTACKTKRFLLFFWACVKR